MRKMENMFHERSGVIVREIVQFVFIMRAFKDSSGASQPRETRQIGLFRSSERQEEEGMSG